jgi:N-acetylmuramoyl-L-alanine amidase
MMEHIKKMAFYAAWFLGFLGACFPYRMESTAGLIPVESRTALVDTVDDDTTIAIESDTDDSSDVTEASEPLENVSPYKAVIEAMTDEETSLLLRILWLEARGESFDGQCKVLEVVFNRVLSDDFPDTVYGVLSERGQFATWKSRDKAQPTQEQCDALMYVYTHEPTLPNMNYVYFDTKGVNGRHHVQVGKHFFGEGR